MNYKHVKNISMVDLLAKLGHQPREVRKEGNEVWYMSPLRTSETKPSFKIKRDANVWYDFGEGEGGNIIDFVIKYDRTDFKGAIELLNNINLPVAANDNPKPVKREVEIKITKISAVFHFALKNYLKQRGISTEVANRYLKEIRYSVDDKEYFALGFRNRKDGWELRNPVFKSCIGEKEISVFELGNKETETRCIKVFEGFMDYLSFCSMSNHNYQADIIVLNSTSMKAKAVEFINAGNYQDIHTYFDNDTAGEKLQEYFKEILGDKNIRTFNYLYSGHKDLNEYWTERLKQAT